MIDDFDEEEDYEGDIDQAIVDLYDSIIVLVNNFASTPRLELTASAVCQRVASGILQGSVEDANQKAAIQQEFVEMIYTVPAIKLSERVLH